MKSLLTALFLIPIMSTYAQEADSTKLGRIDMLIDSLTQNADRWPPNIESDEEKERVVELFEDVKDLLTDFEDEHEDDPTIKWRLGELCRMGHNLDIKNSWKDSEEYLKEALEIDPKYVQAYVTLGLLYVNSGYPKPAEAQFVKAIELATPEPHLTAYSGLAFAYYYQGRRDEAVRMIDRCLQIEPESKYYKSLRNAFQGKR